MEDYTNIEGDTIEIMKVDDEALVGFYVFLKSYVLIARDKDETKRLKDIVYKEIKLRKLTIGSFMSRGK